MNNYLYIWKEPTFTVHHFCKMVRDEKISKEDLIPVDNFIDTRYGYMLYNGKMYQLFANCLCEVGNIICCTEVETL